MVRQTTSWLLRKGRGRAVAESHTGYPHLGNPDIYGDPPDDALLKLRLRILAIPIRRHGGLSCTEARDIGAPSAENVGFHEWIVCGLFMFTAGLVNSGDPPSPTSDLYFFSAPAQNLRNWPLKLSFSYLLHSQRVKNPVRRLRAKFQVVSAMGGKPPVCFRMRMRKSRHSFDDERRPIAGWLLWSDRRREAGLRRSLVWRLRGSRPGTSARHWSG